MRKYIIGILIGCCLSYAAGANAEVITMIGKTVEGVIDLTINGKKMEYQAILIDGTTYAPVRMLAEETGHIVRYDSVTGVKLVKKIAVSKETVTNSVYSVQMAIETNERMILANEAEIIKLQKEPHTDTIISRIKRSEEEIQRLNKSKVNLTNQIDILNQTLVDISAQQAELNPPAPTQP